MFSTYIIYSAQLDKFYTGHSSDLTKRMIEHNSGISKFTSKSNDWALVFSKTFPSREEAFAFEQSIKKKKSRKFILYLISADS